MSLVSTHQKLEMDGQKAGSPRFERKKGVFVERWVILLVLFLVACAIVAVGLLVGYLGPCSSTREDHFDGGATAVTSESEFKVTGPSTDTSRGDEKLDLRLPRSLLPLNYKVKLQPYIVPDNFTFDGHEEVLIECKESTDRIIMHYLNMTIYNDTVRVRQVDDPQQKNLTIKGFDMDEKRQFYVILLGESLKADKNYTVSIRFTGILNDILAGFYRSTYVENDTDKWLALTQFESTDARRAFPCFDEPAMKATFDMTIIKWKNMSAISNMPPIKTESRNDDWEAVTFDTTPKMSTYLLAFIVSQFANRSQTTNNRTFSVWSVPSSINSTDYALDIGPRILSQYDQYFEIPYPLSKMDNVAVPDFNAGAMENWGLVTYRERMMLYDKLTSSSSNKQTVCQTIAHEFGHQWFGDLVTPSWWDDLWLNEGFATYMEYLGCSFVEPTWGMDQQMVIDNVHSAMQLDMLKSSHPIYVPVNNPAEINQIFDSISYDKGASVIRMMEKFLGNDTFTQGLKDYLKGRAYQNAASVDLWNALVVAYKTMHNGTEIDIPTIMNLWTTQTGFPLVTVTRNYDQRTATVSQKRFLIEKTNDSTNATLWQIPLTWADSTAAPSDWSTSTKMWLKEANGNAENLTDANNWVIFNVQEAGYYKVNYDTQNWEMLIKQLKDDHQKIHIINRAQILDDIFDLARTGEVNYSLAMNTTKYLSNESEYIPWTAAISSLSYLASMLRRSDVYGNWTAYVTQLLVPNYEKLGWKEDLDKENILIQYLRVTTISQLCSYNYAPCVETAMKMFSDWKKNPTDNTIIPPNLRNSVYCTAIANSRNSSDWEFMWQRFVYEENPSEGSKLMSALACSQELWLLSRYLREVLSENSVIRKQDGVTVFSNVARNNYGRDIAFNMMRDKWKVLFAYYGGSSFSFGDLVKSVTTTMNTPFEVKQLKEFFQSMTDEELGTSKRGFEQALETVEANVQFMADHYKTIADWLNNMRD